MTELLQAQSMHEIQNANGIGTPDPRADIKAEAHAGQNDIVAAPSSESAASSSAGAVASKDYVAAVNTAMREMKDALNSSASLKALLDTFVNAEDKTEELYEFGHEKVYEMLQDAYALAQTAFDMRRNEWIELSKERGFDITVKTKNKYTRIVKTMWAKWGYCKTEEKYKWHNNRSTEKYANAFRYMDDNNVHVTEIAKKLKSYESEDYGNGLSGIVAADRAAYAAKQASDVPDGKAIALKLAASTKRSTIGVVKYHPTIRRTAGNGIIYLAARLEGDELHLLGDVQIPDKMVANDLQRIMRNTESKIAAE